MKTCSNCKLVKVFAEFYVSKSKGYQSMCKVCSKANKLIWIAENREKVKWNAIWSKYRLRKDDWLRLLDNQNNVCAICALVFPTDVDHDHSCCSGPKSCGKCVRSLLCNPCNSKLNLVEYEPELVLKLQAYLLTHRQEKLLSEDKVTFDDNVSDYTFDGANKDHPDNKNVTRQQLNNTNLQEPKIVKKENK